VARGSRCVCRLAVKAVGADARSTRVRRNRAVQKIGHQSDRVRL
jgi:hypothetical protein